MVYEFLLTFIITFVIVGIIGFVVNTYLSKGEESKRKVFIIYFIQSFIIAVLLIWVV
ncbi:hypothetical protein SFC65_19140 [Priestia filamentosa]|uniref:hypothetical protein n=1 Tax=Priestia filamentosa TaxID=1402861 RepID=UPI00398291FF